MKGAVSMRTLYIRTSRATGAPQTTEVRRVSPLLRELILECVRLGQLRYGNPLHRAIRSLILDQLRMARPLAASVTMPSDSRAVKVAEALLAHPGQSASLHTVCAAAGASVRTIERIFARELGVSIENWRRQVRLMKALEGIVRGVPVKQIAFELGYRQASPFIEMFRRTVGTTPGAWLARDGKI
jgi:AraC-like DNA-binding protein